MVVPRCRHVRSCNLLSRRRRRCKAAWGSRRLQGRGRRSCGGVSIRPDTGCPSAFCATSAKTRRPSETRRMRRDLPRVAGNTGTRLRRRGRTMPEMPLPRGQAPPWSRTRARPRIANPSLLTKMGCGEHVLPTLPTPPREGMAGHESTEGGGPRTPGLSKDPLDWQGWCETSQEARLYMAHVIIRGLAQL